mmetsp:Transcript_4732/g.14374  ORF Transcript_4732/g.14374 Transcript_4732/m.14374 type:complete len:208 (+) Transcript_4732:3130-3753(+)
MLKLPLLAQSLPFLLLPVSLAERRLEAQAGRQVLAQPKLLAQVLEHEPRLLLSAAPHVHMLVLVHRLGLRDVPQPLPHHLLVQRVLLSLDELSGEAGQDRAAVLLHQLKVGVLRSVLQIVRLDRIPLLVRFSHHHVVLLANPDRLAGHELAGEGGHYLSDQLVHGQERVVHNFQRGLHVSPGELFRVKASLGLRLQGLLEGQVRNSC